MGYLNMVRQLNVRHPLPINHHIQLLYLFNIAVNLTNISRFDSSSLKSSVPHPFNLVITINHANRNAFDPLVIPIDAE